jgi:hypothetical protein
MQTRRVDSISLTKKKVRKIKVFIERSFAIYCQAKARRNHSLELKEKFFLFLD